MNKAVILTLIVLAAGVTAGLFYHSRHRAGSSGPFYHVRTEFEFPVHAPYMIAAPLFGPERERVWAGDSWNPRFLYPQPAQDIEGAVFQVSHGHHHSTWVNTAFDLDHGHIQYVYVIPEIMVTRIDLRLSKTSSETTDVRVAYERTALNPAANEHVREFGEMDQANGKTWGDDIERFLATQRPK